MHGFFFFIDNLEDAQKNAKDQKRRPPLSLREEMDSRAVLKLTEKREKNPNKKTSDSNQKNKKSKSTSPYEKYLEKIEKQGKTGSLGSENVT